MKVFFRQTYIEPGATFPFSVHFQRRVTEVVTSLVVPSARFVSKYGDDYDVVFNVSAKRAIQGNEILGPTVFRRTKDVEYTIFLPFDGITASSDVHRSALQFTLDGACWVLQSMEIDTSRIVDARDSIIEEICSNPKMFLRE
jgi:hypothetical protein